MQLGINLPHLGRKAGPEAIRRAAHQAEGLGFDNIWVNDHLAVPVEAPYPPTPLFYEPLITLTWAAAATDRIGLGTSVLILPLRHPVHLAKELATLDLLSGGRLILGAGVGWLEGEFDALGVPYAERGRRTDESIEILRACWEQELIDYDGKVVATTMRQIRTRPQPGRRIPIWIGGTTEAALQRAARLGDGWHGVAKTPEEAAPLIKHLKALRGDGDFTLSMRANWDGLEDDLDELKHQRDGYRDLGIVHLSMEPRQRGLDDWLRSVEALTALRD